MIDLFIYFLKSVLCLSILYVLYVVIIKGKSHLEFRRIYLMVALVASALIPLLNSSWFEFNNNEKLTTINSVLLDQFVTSSLSVTTKISVANITLPSVELLILAIYLVGFSIFISRLVFSLINIYRIKRTANVVYLNGKKLFITNAAEPAFSFFNSIYLSPDTFSDEKKLPIILKHECAHSSQYHSLDTLFAQIYFCFFWFNPLSYFVKKEIGLSNEHLADKKVLAKFDAKEYILTLLDYSTTSKISLVAPFVKHPLKARVNEIIKLKEGSKKHSNWVTAIYVIPVFLVLSVLLSRAQGLAFIPKHLSNDCHCDHMHLTPDNRVMVVEQGEYGPIQRLE